MRIYKTIVMILVLVFSLSPCSLKRNILDIFNIQYVSSLNKTKTIASQTSSCDQVAESISKRTRISKTKFRENKFSVNLYFYSYDTSEHKISENSYSGYTTGNSPPKYILFKRLKLHLI